MSETGQSKATSPASPDDTAKIGRGALYLTGSKFWFLISGYVIYFGLPRLLGDGEEAARAYGDYGVVTGLLALLSQPLIQGTTQAVSRFVSRDPASAGSVRRSAYKLQAVFGGVFFAAMVLGAPVIADRAYDHEALAAPLRCVAFVLVFYAFYAIFAGTLNGKRLFGRQAIADFSYSNLKVIGILGGAAFLSSSIGQVVGPVTGFAIAAGMVMLIGYILAGRAEPGGDVTPKDLLKFQVFTVFFTALSTAIVRMDLQYLKIFAEGSTEQIRLLTGYYQAVQAFATIPFQAVFAITFVLFPLVSGAAGRDDAKIRGYIRETTRYAGIISTIIVGLFAACPERTITILFQAPYASAASVLQILCVGALFYSVFYVMCAIITASGRPGLSSGLMALTVVIQGVVGVSLVGAMGMEGVAIGTSAGMLVGFAAAHFSLTKGYGQGVVISIFARTLGCGAVVAAAAHALLAKTTIWGGAGVLASVGGTGIVSKAVTAGGFAVLGVGYLVLIYAAGVLSRDDVAKFKKVFKKT